VAAKAVTDTTPIVFIVGEDPVKLGLVASLSNPGGNATGVSIFTTELAGKRLQLLHELAPRTSMIGLLVNPKYPGSGLEVASVRAAANAFGRTIAVVEASSERDIDAAFAALAEQQVKALVVGADALFVSRRDQIVALAMRHTVLSIFDLRDYAEAGGLLSYGANLAEMYRLVGVYAGRILRGVAPRELPVEQPTKFELVINLKAATALGLTVPSSLFARADEVIE
jgi:putative ABC transport system substrate-binding protein